MQARTGAQKKIRVENRGDREESAGTSSEGLRKVVKKPTWGSVAILLTTRMEGLLGMS